MNDGIKLLLARMDLHPEEFLRDKDRWEGLFNHYKKYLSEEDKQAFWDKLCEARSKEFTEKVLERLVEEKNDNVAKQKDAINAILEQSLNEAFKEAYESYTHTRHTI